MTAAPAPLLFRNASIIDGTTPEVREGHDVLVEAGLIKEVSDKPLKSSSARIIDLKGKSLLPGLIDCHVHVVAGIASLGGSAAFPDSLVAARTVNIMRGMLMRGFTTVRDVGGADHGLVVAVEEGSILGPRLVISGKALSQTGGHADFRGRFDDRSPAYYTSQARRRGPRGRWRAGDPARRARGDQGRRPVHQDHGQRRRRLADRPHRLLRLLERGAGGRGRGSPHGPDLRRRPPLHR